MILQKILFGKMYFDWGLLPREQGLHKTAWTCWLVQFSALIRIFSQFVLIHACRKSFNGNRNLKELSLLTSTYPRDLFQTKSINESSHKVSGMKTTCC